MNPHHPSSGGDSHGDPEPASITPRHPPRSAISSTQIAEPTPYPYAHGVIYTSIVRLSCAGQGGGGGDRPCSRRAGGGGGGTTGAACGGDGVAAGRPPPRSGYPATGPRPGAPGLPAGIQVTARKCGARRQPRRGRPADKGPHPKDSPQGNLARSANGR
jgi:hypothetical protein